MKYWVSVSAKKMVSVHPYFNVYAITFESTSTADLQPQPKITVRAVGHWALRTDLSEFQGQNFKVVPCWGHTGGRIKPWGLAPGYTGKLVCQTTPQTNMLRPILPLGPVQCAHLLLQTVCREFVLEPAGSPQTDKKLQINSRCIPSQRNTRSLSI